MTFGHQEKKKRKSTTKKPPKPTDSKKRNSEIRDPLSAPKKQTKRRVKSELIVPSTTQICDVKEEDVKSGLCITNSETKNSVTADKAPDSVDNNDSKTHLNDCYVKICRTPLKEVCKTKDSLDDTCITLDEGDLPDFGLLYRKLNTKDSSGLINESCCIKSATKIEAKEKVPVDCGVLGATLEACQELEHDQDEDLGPDQIVPDEGEVKCLETGSDNGELMTLSEPVIVEDASDVPVTTFEGVDSLKMEENSDAETEAPRKRRAALKISSFKEPNLNKKMRRGGDSSLVTTGAPKKSKSNSKFGRKSSCS